MGRATIIANLGEGLYKIQLQPNLAKLEVELAKIAAQDAAFSQEIAAATATMNQLLVGKYDAEEALSEVIGQWKANLISPGDETPPEYPNTGPPGTSPEQQMADELFTALNAARTAASVATLSRAEELDGAMVLALAYLANNRTTTDTQYVPEARAVKAGYVYDYAIGAAELLAFGQADNDTTVSYWLRLPSSKAILLSEDFTEIGVAAHYDAATAYTYSRGVLLSAPGTIPGLEIELPEEDPAKEAAAESDASLVKIETPKTDSGQPSKVQVAVTVYRKAVAAYEAAAAEVARIRLESQVRAARKDTLLAIQAAAEGELWAWTCAYVDDLAVGATVSTAEVPGWFQETAVERQTEMGVRNDPSNTIPSWTVNYTERSINLVPDAAAVVGQLGPSETLSDATVFVNAALEPGWMKWEPLWRYGTVTARTGALCDVTLQNLPSRKIQSSEETLAIDESLAMTGVPITFLLGTCLSLVVVGDEVLIKFTGQDRTRPEIIGWRREPKPCQVQRISWGQIV